MPQYLPMLLSRDTVVELKRVGDGKDGVSDFARKELRSVTTEALRRSAATRRAA